jgi:hypothetical protein
VNAHDAADRLGYGRAALVDMDTERVAVPLDPARADDQLIGTTMQLATTAFCHCPGTTVDPVQRYVESAVVLWVAATAASGPGVVGREDASDQRDDGDAALAVVAQRIDVPPLVAVAV